MKLTHKKNKIKEDENNKRVKQNKKKYKDKEIMEIIQKYQNFKMNSSFENVKNHFKQIPPIFILSSAAREESIANSPKALFIKNVLDNLFFITDGYADQFGGPKGKKFKYAQLKELLHKNSSLPYAEQENSLEREFRNWRAGHDQVDDVTIIGVRL